MGLRPGYGIRLESAEELLATSSPVGTVELDWPAARVRVSAYLGRADLPTEIPHRVRCLVTRGSDVLVIWDVFGTADCFPGGGAEGAETVAETACREVLEETGWHLDPSTLDAIGWMHVHSHVDPAADHPFPHPDGFMTVLRANPLRAEVGHEEWADTDGFVTRSQFVPIDQVPESIRDSPIHAPFLRAVFGPVR